MKLVVNMVMGTMMASFAEGLTFAEKAGLSKEDFIKVSPEALPFCCPGSRRHLGFDRDPGGPGKGRGAGCDGRGILEIHSEVTETQAAKTSEVFKWEEKIRESRL
jgi:hypothetical protein